MNKKVVFMLFTSLALCLNGCNDSQKQSEKPMEQSAQEKQKPPFDPNALTEVAAFLAENGPFFISTVDGDQPRVRPFGFVMAYDGKLWFSTRTGKEIVKQLKVNPWVEICAVSKADGASWIRVRGKALIVDSPAAKEYAFETSPDVKSLYKTIDNPQFTLFPLEDGEVSFNTFTGKPRIVSF